jgi:hypothetical protein
LGNGPEGQATFSSADATPTLNIANTSTGSGLHSESLGGYGGELKGGTAPLRLVPSKTAGNPKSGAHQRGELMVDSKGHLYLCVTGGSPGKWRKL